MAQPRLSGSGAPAIQRGGWLDLLRFVAATLMIVHHYEKAGPVALDTFHPVFDRGYLLTDFFLIDSGYVLARIYAARMAAGMSVYGFLKKRVTRLLPAHLAMILGLGGLVTAATAAGMAPRHPEWFDWSQYPAQLFLVQAYGVPGGLGWNAPTWSISALLGCYLAFPTLVRLFAKLSPLQALIAGAAVYAVADVLAHRFLGFPVYQMPLRHGFFRALPLFLVGVAVARFSDGVALRPWTARVVGLGALATLVALQASGAFSLASLALICTLIAAAAAIPVGRRSPLIELGALASFSIFISNEVVRIFYFGAANALIARLRLPEAAQWALWCGGVVSAMVFALGFYIWFDAPTQAWIAAADRRDLFGPRRMMAWVRARLPRPVQGEEILARRTGLVYFEVLTPKGRMI